MSLPRPKIIVDATSREKQLCRLCLVENELYLNIFASISHVDLTISDVLSSYLGVEVTPDDDLPHFICCDCLEEVRNLDCVSREAKRTMGYLIWRQNALAVESKDILQSDPKRRSHYVPSSNQDGPGCQRTTLDLYEDLPSPRNPTDALDGELDFPELNLVGGFRLEGNGFPERGKRLEFSSESRREQDDEVHRCAKCGEELLGAIGLRRHTKLFHSDDSKGYACGKCCRKFSRRKSLAKHIKKHDFRCKWREIEGVIEELNGVDCVGTIEPGDSTIGKSYDEFPVEDTHNTEIGGREIVETFERAAYLSRNVIKKLSSEGYVGVTTDDGGNLSADETRDDFPVGKRPKKRLRHAKKSKITKIIDDLLISTGELTKDVGKDVSRLPNDSSYVCSHCESAFADKFLLEEHFKECILHSVDGELGVSGKSTVGVETPAVSGSSRNTYACDVCTESFTSKKKLVSHLKETHGAVRPVVCMTCKLGFCTYLELGIHRPSHKGSKPLVCKTCGGSFSSKDYFKHHVLRCEKKIVPLQCGVCDKLSSSSSNLKKHYLLHLSIKKYSCQFCEKRYTERGDLTVHLRAAHTHHRPYKCGICQRSFANKSHLTVHIVTHSDERPFKCEVCGRRFKRCYVVKQHIRKIHRITDDNDVLRSYAI